MREQAESPWEVRRGQMLAGNSFVTAHNVKDTREAFEGAISTDMETTAIAQVCHNYEIPFIGVRCVSDLCGPEADQDFHLSVDVVAPRSARYAAAAGCVSCGPKRSWRRWSWLSKVLEHAARCELACGKCRGVNLTGLRPALCAPVLLCRSFCTGFCTPVLFLIRHFDVPGP